MEIKKAIKRSLKKGKVKFKYRDKLNDVIFRANLFIKNIFDFIALFYVYKDKSYAYNLKSTDIYTIYEVLKFGEDFYDKENRFYKFFIASYKNLYFNPNKTKESILINSQYLDQVMKLNIGVIFTSIQNNIIYNLEKYILRFIKVKFRSNLKNSHQYNSLIKKCSTYEMYIDNNISNKFYVQHMIECLKYQKSIDKNYFNMTLLSQLGQLLEGKIKKGKIERSKNNIFLDELKRIKEIESTFNKNKTLIKKILCGEKEVTEINKLNEIYKTILTDISNFFSKDTIYNNYVNTLNNDPFIFIEAMIKMNNYFKDNKAKTYNVFPRSNTLIPKHITLDTASINVIFLNNKYNKNISDNKEEIWKEVFGLVNRDLRYNTKYSFSGTIQTDGLSLSLIYDQCENIEKKKTMSQIKTEARLKINAENKKTKELIQQEYELKIKEVTNKIKKIKEEKQNCKNKKMSEKFDLELIDLNILVFALEEDLKEKINESLNKNKYEREAKKKEKEKLKKQQNVERIKKLKEEKKKKLEEYKKENNEDEIKKSKRAYKEFYMLEDLIETELNELKNKIEQKKVLYFDLGKTRLFYCLGSLNGENKFMKYTGKERGSDLKTKMHKSNIEKLRSKLKISESDKVLSELNTRSTKKEEMNENLKKQNEENLKNYKNFLNKNFRQEKLQMYRNKKRTEEKMIDKIVKMYNLNSKLDLKEIIAIVGDWKGNNKLKNNKSSLGIGMKRLFKKYFKCVYLIDETNTSKLNHITHKEMDHLTVEIKSTSKEGLEKIINKRLHEVLTFKSEKKCISYVDKTFGEPNYKPKYSDEKEKVIEEGKIMVTRYLQRDKNAVLNFEYLTDYFVKNKSRPKEYTKLM